MEILLGVLLFTVIVLLLVAVILFAKSKLVAEGNVNILINGEKTIAVAIGTKLLATLANKSIFIPSACGGGGTWAQCQ